MQPESYSQLSYLAKQPALVPYAYDRISDTYRAIEAQKDFGGATYNDFSGILTGTLNSEFILDNSCGHSTIGFHLTIPSGGAVSFNGSFDGINYAALELRELSSNGYIIMSNSDNDYLGSISALRKLKFLVTSGNGVDGYIAGRTCKDVASIDSIENNAPPHQIGNALFHKGVNYSDGGTGNMLIYSPNNNSRFVVTDLSFGVISTAGVNVTFHEAADSGVNADNWVYSTYVKTNSTQSTPINISFATPFVASGMNNGLYMSSDASLTIRGIIHGYCSKI